MQTDFFLVAGILLALLGFPSLLSAFSESRAPRLAMILFMAGGILIVLAVTGRPGGYAMADIPEAFLRVIATLRR
ncbi:hypothetical protein [Alkalilacustris brevis]|uniref:hypothetical protein n=1 Tax=Alkalilacustris brevis TaxID=2026338 RepID=UPI000E0DFD39|nr:hypothetical protein [Alkalilacustris brevis]